MRALSTDARVEIQDLYSRYNEFIDHDRFDEWLDLFTDDGVADFASGFFRGREQLEGYVRERAEREAEQPYDSAQHWNTNLVLSERDGVVHGSCYLVRFAIDRKTRAQGVINVGRYEDEIVQVSGRWRFRRRQVFLFE